MFGSSGEPIPQRISMSEPATRAVRPLPLSHGWKDTTLRCVSPARISGWSPVSSRSQETRSPMIAGSRGCGSMGSGLTEFEGLPCLLGPRSLVRRDARDLDRPGHDLRTEVVQLWSDAVDEPAAV